MKKKILKITVNVLLILAVIVSSVVLNGLYFEKRSKVVDFKYYGWMLYIADEVPVVDIVMPGSHDAGTYDMNYLGRTQAHPIAKQLNIGVRYFDLRVNKTEEGYFLYHAMFDGENFVDVLEDIKTFITENPSETLILDFQHFKGGSEADVAAMLEASLASEGLAVKNETEQSDLAFISTLPLGQARGKCVILFGGNEVLVSEHDFLFNRNNDACTKEGQALNSCYISEYHKGHSAPFIEEGLPAYYQNIKDKIEREGHKGLFVLQGQLTDGFYIFGPYAKEKWHDDRMSDYVAGIKDDPERLALTNIVMRDFLTLDKCKAIIALNYHKGTVQEVYMGVFEIYAF